jgi:hypothetical protein
VVLSVMTRAKPPDVERPVVVVVMRFNLLGAAYLARLPHQATRRDSSLHAVVDTSTLKVFSSVFTRASVPFLTMSSGVSPGLGAVFGRGLVRPTVLPVLSRPTPVVVPPLAGVALTT